MAKEKNFTRDLSLACTTDELRPTMEHLYFKDGHVIGTDAHILIKQKLTLHNFSDEEAGFLEGRLLHREAFKELYRYDFIEAQPDGTILARKKGGKVKVKFETELEGRDGNVGQYPNFEAVIPKESGELSSIGVNLNLMAKLSKLALHENGLVELRFFAANTAIVARSVDRSWEDETLLVMPIMVAAIEEDLS